MSRFSLAEAQGLGWSIVHESDGQDKKPVQLVAEKHVVTPNGNDTLVHEEAPTMGLLLERVFAYEAHLAKYNPQPVVDYPVTADADEDQTP